MWPPTAGDALLYDLYMAQLPKLTDKPEEYYRFFNALPSFRDPALVQRTLRFAISPDVRTQDTPRSLPVSSAALVARRGWAFVKENWDALTKTLGISKAFHVSRVPSVRSARERNALRWNSSSRSIRSRQPSGRCAARSNGSTVALRVKERQAPAASSWLASAAR
jgi:hypothetical protein